MAAATRDDRDDLRYTILFECGDAEEGYRRQLAGLPDRGPVYLLTVDTGERQLLPTTDVEALEAAAAAEGFSVVATHPIAPGRSARLWVRADDARPSGSALPTEDVCA
jgi:hypothetical protein